jgi:hypothetical protein
VGKKLELLSSQYLAKCLRPDHPCHSDVTVPRPPRSIKQSLQSRHSAAVALALGEGENALRTDEPLHRKAILSSLHTNYVRESVESREANRVLGHQPPPVDKSQQYLEKSVRCRLSQLQSGMCSLLASFQNKLNPNVSDLCPDCKSHAHTTQHLFVCRPVATTAIDLWERPGVAAASLAHLINK